MNHSFQPDNGHGWGDAFAALPLETPPADGWQRLASQLPAAPRRRTRRVNTWAAAAAIATLAALPAWVMLPSPAPDQRAAPPVASTTNAIHGPATAAQPSPPGPTEAPDDAAARSAAARDVSQPAVAAVATVQHHVPATTAVPVQTRASAAAATPASLEALHAESAHLEALLQALSAETPVDGAQLAMSLSLRAQVDTIDATLASGSLDADERDALWRRRVAVLRELAGMAGDQRWSALMGQPHLDYALVQVY